MKKTDQYDAVIIGSGAGGGACAWALSQGGMKVLVLEAGAHYDPFADYKLDQSSWEQQIFPYKSGSQGRHSFSRMQALLPAWNDLRSWNHLQGKINPSDHRVPIGYHHVLGVGGSSLHFTGEAHRLNPNSMKMHSQFNVAADWPMSYRELEPYYLLAEKMTGVAGPPNPYLRPRSAPYPQKAHPLSYASQQLSIGFQALGLSLTQNSLAVLSSPESERPNCNYCGGCLRGCPRTDKGSIDVTYLRKATASGNCTILANAAVTRIETGVNDQVRGVHYRYNKQQHFVSSPLLIVSCGAVETPRLLLVSTDNNAPQGLANESGEVGQNFMETIFWTSNALHPRPLGSHRGLPVDSICWDYNNPDSIKNVIGGCRFSPSQAESDLVGPINYARRVVGGWGKAHKQKMRDTFGHVLSLTGMSESLPNKNTFITLDKNLRDQNGVPIAEIHSFLDDMAIRRIAFMAERCRSVLTASGAEPIFEEISSIDIFSSTHVFGTCRMGENPDYSVVNPWCQSHRWKNLYIIDASIFPSSGGGESPGLTIQALALRAAKKILSN